MRFLVLGSLEIYDGDRHVDVSAHKQRVLLATLVSRVGKPVSADRLVGALWGDEPPGDVKRALGWHLLQLRNALGGSDRIVHQPGGYALRAEPDDVDAEVFQRLVRDSAAAGDPGAVRRRLMEGLALWRGAAYTDLADTEPLRQEARRLEELRLSALERHCAIGLRLGEHAGLVPELSTLVAENPYREQFRAKLMLALYRSGRPADALEVYREGRERAVRELGIEPGPGLRALERRILAGDPELDLPDTGSTAVPGPSPVTPVPHQLPAGTTAFTGREAEVDALLHQARPSVEPPSGTIVVSALDGMAGIGKTTLAVHVAHLLAPHYPDGQLFIDLHGFSGEIAAVPPHEALDRMLRALGVPGTGIPEHVDDRAALFRSILNGKRVLLVLDNAAGEAQVRPLLPGGGRHLTLITSRRRLSGLEDATTVSLDLLDDRHGRRLFERTAGLSDVSEGESAVVDDIVSLCGGLPLAIRLAAHRFGRTASWSLADLRERLRGHDRALATLSVGNRSVTAAFRLSYQELDEAHRRTFRLLSLYPGPGFDAYAAVALADLEPEEASDRLDELCDAHLLQSPSPGRYRFHDLVREYAAAELSTAGDDTTAAVTRLLDGLRHTAYHVANLVYPNVKHYPYVPPVPAFAVPSLPDAETAADWYDTEIAALHGAVRLAVEYGLDVHAWQLAHPVDALNHYRGHVAAGLAMNQTALVAARRLDDPEVLAFALNNTATCHVMLSQFAAAVETFEEALELRRHGDARGRAAVHNNLGTALRRLGEFTAAASHFEAAVECARQAGTERLEAVAIANYAAVCDHLGQWSRALGLLERARGICERPGFERQLARVDHWCGVTYLNLGEPRRALEHLHRSRAFAEGVTESFGLCEVLNSIAVCLRTLGRHADALRHHRLAVDLSGELGDTAAHARNLTDFGRTLTDAGQAEAAIAALSEARALAIEVDSRYDAARAAHGLAEALIVTGATEDARRCLDAAADAYRAMGVPAAAGLREPRRRLENRR